MPVENVNPRGCGTQFEHRLCKQRAFLHEISGNWASVGTDRSGAQRGRHTFTALKILARNFFAHAADPKISSRKQMLFVSPSTSHSFTKKPLICSPRPPRNKTRPSVLNPFFNHQAHVHQPPQCLTRGAHNSHPTFGNDCKKSKPISNQK